MAPLVPATHVAIRLGLPVWRIYALAKQGHIPCVRISPARVMFDPDSIERFIAKGGIAATVEMVAR